MNRRTRWLILVVGLLMVAPVFGQSAGARYYLLEDSSRQLTASQALGLFQRQQFKENNTGQFNPGFTRSVYWLAVVLDSPVRATALRLVAGTPHINKLDFYAIENGKPVHRYQTGDHFPFARRPLETVPFAFPLEPGGRYYLVRADKHHESLQFTFRLMSADELMRSESRNAMITGVLSGIILLLLVFGVYLALITRKRIYLLYIFYVSAGWLWVLSDLGFGYKYLWPGNAWFASRSRPVFSELTIILSIQYLVYYMGGVKWRPLRLMLNVTTWIASALLLLWLVPVDVYAAPAVTWIMLKLIPAIAAVYVILGLAALALEARRKNKMALFYFAALIPLMLMVFINLLNHSGLINITGTSLEHYGVAVGYVTEVIILTFGLAYSFNSHRLEKERLQLRYEVQQKENARALIDTEARERKRIADELHDIAGSMLSAAKLNISALREKNFLSDPEARVKLEKAEQALSAVSGSVRNLSHALSPIMLEKYGLRKSLETAAGFFSSSGKLKIELAVIGFEKFEPALHPVYTMLYSVIYECLNNVVKHSGASQMILQLVEHEDSINLMVEDNGRGLPQAQNQLTKGLSGIVSKVNYFNGAIAFDNTGTGLVISIEIPKPIYEQTGSISR